MNKVKELKDQLAAMIRDGRNDEALWIALDLIGKMEEDITDLAEQLRKAKMARYFGGELQDYQEDGSRLYQGGQEKLDTL